MCQCYHIRSYTLVYTGSERPALKYLNRHVVVPITPKWHDVGLELMEIEDENLLGIIKAEQSIDDQERAKRMLNLWRDKQTNASWNGLIKVLRIPNIGLLSIALKIEGMLLPESMHAFNNIIVIWYATINLLHAINYHNLCCHNLCRKIKLFHICRKLCQIF